MFFTGFYFLVAEIYSFDRLYGTAGTFIPQASRIWITLYLILDEGLLTVKNAFYIPEMTHYRMLDSSYPY